MKTVFALLSLFLLAGCFDPTPEQKAKLKAALPPGCWVEDIGRYGAVDRLVVVICEKHRTMTAHSEVRHGKSFTRVMAVWIDQ